MMRRGGSVNALNVDHHGAPSLSPQALSPLDAALCNDFQTPPA